MALTVVVHVVDFVCSISKIIGGQLMSNAFASSGLFAIQGPSELKVVVDDSREGWRDALEVLLEAYFFGHTAPEFDMSQLR